MQDQQNQHRERLLPHGINSNALMQADTDRLHGLITNLLTAGRMEHKGVKLTLQVDDLSQMISDYLQQKKKTFPPEGRLEWQIEPHLLEKVMGTLRTVGAREWTPGMPLGPAA